MKSSLRFVGLLCSETKPICILSSWTYEIDEYEFIGIRLVLTFAQPSGKTRSPAVQALHLFACLRAADQSPAFHFFNPESRARTLAIPTRVAQGTLVMAP